MGENLTRLAAVYVQGPLKSSFDSEKGTDRFRKCFFTRDIWVDFKENICQLIL